MTGIKAVFLEDLPDLGNAAKVPLGTTRRAGEETRILWLERQVEDFLCTGMGVAAASPGDL